MSGLSPPIRKRELNTPGEIVIDTALRAADAIGRAPVREMLFCAHGYFARPAFAKHTPRTTDDRSDDLGIYFCPDVEGAAVRARARDIGYIRERRADACTEEEAHRAP